jgi:hypothetical protein
MKHNDNKKSETTSSFVALAKDISKNKIVKILLFSALAVGIIFIGGKIMKVCAGAVGDFKNLKAALNK